MLIVKATTCTWLLMGTSVGYQDCYLPASFSKKTESGPATQAREIRNRFTSTPSNPLAGGGCECTTWLIPILESCPPWGKITMELL